MSVQLFHWNDTNTRKILQMDAYETIWAMSSNKNKTLSSN